MKHFQDMLYEKQALLITKLYDNIKSLENDNKALCHVIEQKQHASDFYFALIKAIGDNIMLQDEWRRFISILRLTDPDIPGLTKAEKEFD